MHWVACATATKSFTASARAMPSARISGSDTGQGRLRLMIVSPRRRPAQPMAASSTAPRVDRKSATIGASPA